MTMFRKFKKIIAQHLFTDKNSLEETRNVFATVDAADLERSVVIHKVAGGAYVTDLVAYKRQIKDEVIEEVVSAVFSVYVYDEYCNKKKEFCSCSDCDGCLYYAIQDKLSKLKERW